MAIAMKNKSGAGPKDVPEAGTHLARLVGIVDLDHQPGFEWQGEQIESQYKVTFTYELCNSMTKDGKPHWVSEDFKVSDHERSNMFARVGAMDPNGSLTHSGQDLSGLIGAPCMVEVKLNPKGYSKVHNVSGAPAGFPVPELVNPSFVFDFESPDMGVYTKLPEFVQDKLKSSLNYEGSALHTAIVAEGDTDGKAY
jgi:hypothetical protein